MKSVDHFSAIFPSSTKSVHSARRRIITFCRPYLRDADLFDMELAVGEALANSIEHGCAKEIVVHCWVEHATLVVEIKDDGRGFEHQRIADPERQREMDQQRGRGIFLMRTMIDMVEFEDGGRSVRLTKRIPPALDGELDQSELA